MVTLPREPELCKFRDRCECGFEQLIESARIENELLGAEREYVVCPEYVRMEGGYELRRKASESVRNKCTKT